MGNSYHIESDKKEIFFQLFPATSALVITTSVITTSNYVSKDLDDTVKRKFTIDVNNIVSFQWLLASATTLDKMPHVNSFICLKANNLLVECIPARTPAVILQSTRFILEFVYDSDLINLVQALPQLGPDPVPQMLIDDAVTAVDYLTKRTLSGTVRDKFSVITSKFRVVFTYPFLLSDSNKSDEGLLQAIETAGSDLDELSYGRQLTFLNNTDRLTTEERGSLWITYGDYDLLNDKIKINDILIDFWMLWVSRHISKQFSNIHYFSTQFLTKLISHKQGFGVGAARRWCKRAAINIFEKKFLFLPFNKDDHWSLFVVVNPGEICRCDDGSRTDSPFTCIMLFDSYPSIHGRHQYSLRSNIIKWLNNEWKAAAISTVVEPFNQESIVFLTPKGRCFVRYINCLY